MKHRLIIVIMLVGSPALKTMDLDKEAVEKVIDATYDSYSSYRFAATDKERVQYLKEFKEQFTEVNKALMKFQNDFNIADENHVGNFDDVYSIKLFVNLDFMRDFYLKYVAFEQLKPSFENFKKLLVSDVFIDEFKKNKKTFTTLFTVYENYIKRYFIAHFFQKFYEEASDIFGMMGVDLYDSFLEEQKIFMTSELLPENLRTALDNNGLAQNEDLQKIFELHAKGSFQQQVKGLFEKLIGFNQRNWPQPFTKLGAEDMKAYLNEAERVATAMVFREGDRQHEDLEKILPDVETLNDKLKDIPELQDFVQTKMIGGTQVNQIPMLVFVHDRIQELKPTAPPAISPLDPAIVQQLLAELAIDLTALNAQV